MVCAFLNIEMQAVGNWAERNGLAYSGYVDLTAKPEVYALLQECVEKVNEDLAQESSLAGSQVRRFLVLHKELDADDDELTRTRKVRRNFVEEKYAPLVSALFSGANHCKIETQVKFEDGRSGVIRADVTIRDVEFVQARNQRKAA
jgi:long-chain acyl-CoA synthetase